MATATEIELDMRTPDTNRAQLNSVLADDQDSEHTDYFDETSRVAANLTTAIPDGGYGWVVVFSCSLLTFHLNGWGGSWGIIQAHLLETTLSAVPTSTLTYVGSLSISVGVALGLVSTRITRMIGARWSATVGVTLLGLGEVLSGSSIRDLGGLFAS